jgi:plastocyanin
MFIIAAVVIALLIAAVTTFALTRKRTELPLSVPTVEITNEGFNPAVIKIKKGNRVQWVNKDVQLHQVAADPHPTGESLPSLKSAEPLLQEEVYSAVFEKSGTYTYHDFLDPLGFQATVIVE